MCRQSDQFGRYVRNVASRCPCRFRPKAAEKVDVDSACLLRWARFRPHLRGRHDDTLTWRRPEKVVFSSICTSLPDFGRRGTTCPTLRPSSAVRSERFANDFGTLIKGRTQLPPPSCNGPYNPFHVFTRQCRTRAKVSHIPHQTCWPHTT